MPMKLPAVGVACWLACKVRLPLTVDTVVAEFNVMFLAVETLRLFDSVMEVAPANVIVPAVAASRITDKLSV